MTVESGRRRATVSRRRSSLVRRTLLSHARAIGVDIGGTKVAAGVVDGDGTILARTVRPTPGHEPEEVEALIAEVINELVGSYRVAAVGIGAAGFVDETRSIVRFSPHLAWRNEPLRSAVEARVRQRLGYLVGRRTVVENDANCAVWAEYRFGAARGSSRLIGVTVGTGIGGGIVDGGQLRRGRWGMAAEFGHMIVDDEGRPCECGGRGCWEQYCSGNSLGRRARLAVQQGRREADDLLDLVDGRVDALDGRVVAQAVERGHDFSRKMLSEQSHWLAVGLANLIAAFDPEHIVIGGGLSELGETLVGPARDELQTLMPGAGHRPMPTLAVASAGPDAGVVGAADLARGWG